MPFGAHNATTTASDMAAAQSGWSTGLIYNNSDTTVYVKYTADAAEVTTANGIPIPAAGSLRLISLYPGVNPAIRIIHGGSGNKEVRYALQ